MHFFHLLDFEHCIRLFLGVFFPSQEDDEVIIGSYGLSALPRDSTDEDEVSTSVLSICTKTNERYEDLPQTYSAYLVQQNSLDKCMYYFFQILLYYLSISQISKLDTYPNHSTSTFIDDGLQNPKKTLE